MKKTGLMVSMVFLAAACAPISKEAKQDLDKPVNCATAPGDIRALTAEKANAAKEVAAGATAISPVSLVMNEVTRSEGDHVQVATGEYNQMIDKKIAEIKQQCGIQ